MKKPGPGDFIFNTGQAVSSAVEIEFADGRHVVPEWLVAQLGGTTAVTSEASRAAARQFTYEDFMRRFHSKVASATLSGIGKQIIRQHLQRRPWEK